MKWDKTSKMGSGLTSQYKHSANLIGDDIIVNKLSCWWGEAWHKVATDASWAESLLLTKILEEVTICKPSKSVLPLVRLNSHFLYSFLKIPNFCLDRHFGFSVHQEYIPFLCPLFLPRPPFWVFSPPGRSLLPKPPFQVFSLASFYF